MRFLLPMLLFAVAVAAEPTAGEGDMSIVGKIGGRLALAQLRNAPALQWRTEVRTKGRGWVAVSTAEGNGTRLQLETALENGAAGTWRIVDAKLDLAAWEPALAELLGHAAHGLHFAGTVTLTGSGTLRAGSAQGEIVVAVKDGRISNPDAGWTLDGITLGGNFALTDNAASIRSSAPLTVSVTTIQTKRFGARNLVVHGTLEDRQTFALASARVEIAGGDMVAAATTVSLSPLSFLAEVTLNRIGLPDVAALVPTALKNARGRVDGTVQIGWAGAGIQIGRGHLVIREDEPAEVTLRPFPGLLTSWMQPWMRKLPSWLVKWPGPKLVDAEMGRTPIEAKTLDITFSPQPDEQGRTAIVHLVGVPKGAAGSRVDITTNVFGPLKPFIQLGTETNLRFAVGK